MVQTAQNTYKLTLPAAWKVVNKFNVLRLCQYSTRPEWMGQEQPAPPLVVDPVSGVQEHEVHETLRFRLHYDKPQCLVRWAGKDASGDTCETVEHLTNCEEALRDFEIERGIAVPRAPQASASPFPALPSPPNGFSIKAA